MVLVNGMKYACETCIKGHRSSSCKHTDRPLFEIKKKGRPVTQCEHCRELRKTKQIHVKCNCETKEDGPAGTSKQGVPKVPASAAFPSGLPEALEASVALQAHSSDGSDSDHSGACSCKDAGSCNCWTPRVSKTARAKRAARARRGSSGSVSAEEGSTLGVGSEHQMSRPAGLVVNAHGMGRPVLPKPPSLLFPSPQQQSSGGHDPSNASTAKTHGRHSPTHGHMYSPYGRAYEYQYGGEAVSDDPFSQSLLPTQSSTPETYSEQNPINENDIPWFPEFVRSSFGENPASISLCGCGSNCACLGCAEHRGPDANGSKSCANPASCMACLDCMTLPVPPNIRFDTDAMPIGSPRTQQIVDNWLQQVTSSSQSSSTTAYSPSSYSPLPPENQESMQFDPVLYALWANANGSSEGQDVQVPVPMSMQVAATMDGEKCCGGRCACPVGMCTCGTKCCGCCEGCRCVGCAHEDPGKMLTFAVSGERGACCAPQLDAPRPVLPLAGGRMEFLSEAYQSQSAERRASVSRASSLSSHSSGHPSHSSSSFVSEDEALRLGGEGHREIGLCCSGMRTANIN